MCPGCTEGLSYWTTGKSNSNLLLVEQPDAQPRSSWFHISSSFSAWTPGALKWRPRSRVEFHYSPPCWTRCKEHMCTFPHPTLFPFPQNHRSLWCCSLVLQYIFIYTYIFLVSPCSKFSPIASTVLFLFGDDMKKKQMLRYISLSESG